jgi:rhomboid protease GluP
MNHAELDSLLSILRRCGEAAPNPWYPSQDPALATIRPDGLDAHLDRLRLGGLMQLTDWVQGRGQGYVLTPAGAYILENPRELARLRDGAVMAAPGAQPAWQDEGDVDSDRGKAVRNLARRPVRPVVTVGLIVINVLWFLAGMAQAYRENVPAKDYLYVPPMNVLIETGALAGALIAQGQWWRLLSNCFVHIGLLHLALNMWSLYVMGRIQEGLWGHMRFLAIYLISGLGGSCAMVIANPQVVGAGASGAIFGLMSSLAIWLILNRRFLGEGATSLLRRLMLVFVLNILISAAPHISAAAHFGGAATGLVVAFLLNEQQFRRGVVRWLCLVGVLAIPLFCFIAVRESKRLDERWEPLEFEAVRKPLARKAEIEANRVIETKVQPLERKHMRSYSLEEVRQGTEALKEARDWLTQSVEVMASAGPYRDKNVEEERTRILDDLKKNKEHLERAEYQNFVNLLASDTKTDASRIWSKVLLQVLSDPQTRDPREVADMMADITKQQASLASAAELLQSVGPYHSPDVEEARARAHTELDSWARMFSSAALCLRRGTTWTKEEQEEFGQQPKEPR